MSGMRLRVALFSFVAVVALSAHAQLANQDFESGLGAWSTSGS